MSTEAEDRATAEKILDRRAFTVLAAIFAWVHAVYYALGLRFDMGPIQGFIHYMDPALLEHRLLETCFYMHIQPPLLNLFVGAGLKLPEPLSQVVFQIVFLFFGLTLYVGLYVLQRRLGVSRRIAMAAGTVFLASPSFVIYEHWLFYTFPCAMLLVVAALLLLAVLETRSRWALGGFFTVLLVLCGTRSMFHLVYFLAVLAVGLYVCKGYRKRVAVMAALPLILLCSWYFKNYVLFGKFTACTFTGKNLWITTVGNLGWEERSRLIEEGKISELSRINRWSSLSPYPEEYRNVEGFEGIPVLRETHKRTGAVNYNHLGQIRVCEEYGKDALFVLAHRPRAFMLAVAISGFRYFKSSTSLPLSNPNREALRVPIWLYDHILYGKLPIDPPAHGRFLELARTPPYIVLLTGLPILFCYGLYMALTGRPAAHSMTPTQRIVIMFMCFNIIYVAVLGCAFDIGETNRYRFMTDPFYVTLLGVLIQHIRSATVFKKRRSC